MFKHLTVLVLFVCLHTQSSTTSSSGSYGSLSLKRSTTSNKFVSVNAACSRKNLLAVVVLTDSFHGILYARGYPVECSVVGDGSKEVKLAFPVDQCGTKITEKADGSLQFDVYLYLQYERHVQQASDEVIQVNCVPQDVVVSSRVVPAKPGLGHFSLSSYTSSSTTTQSPPHLNFDSWMDILRGKMPTAVPITDFVNVGEEITMLIKIRHGEGVEAKVTDCIATDGSSSNEQLLLDSNGCPVDPSIMPNLEEKYNMKTGVKMLYSTFEAFRFPERENLHLQCKVLVCNYSCPLASCFQSSRWSTRGKSRSHRESGFLQRIVDEMDVFNTVEVKQPLSDINFRKTASSLKDAPVIEHTVPPQIPAKSDNLFCLNSGRMIAIVGVLLGVLLMSLVVTICMCVRAKELRRRLMEKQSFPYGRVHEYS